MATASEKRSEHVPRFLPVSGVVVFGVLAALIGVESPSRVFAISAACFLRPRNWCSSEEAVTLVSTLAMTRKSALPTVTPRLMREARRPLMVSWLKVFSEAAAFGGMAEGFP